VLRWWGGESRVEPSGGFVVVMAGGGLGGGVLGFFLWRWWRRGIGLDGDWLCLICVRSKKRKVEAISGVCRLGRTPYIPATYARTKDYPSSYLPFYKVSQYTYIPPMQSMQISRNSDIPGTYIALKRHFCFIQSRLPPFWYTVKTNHYTVVRGLVPKPR